MDSHFAAGVLFVEDFDDAPSHENDGPEIIVPVFSAEDVQAAREEGRTAGAEEARTEQEAIQSALRTAALAAIGDGLANARADASRVAESRAEEIAAALLALLAAALPATSARLAPQEVAAVLAAVLPPLSHTPDVRVRVHPAILDDVCAYLAAFDGVSASADASLAPSDVCVTWQDGQARRDWTELWAQITAALAPFALPTLPVQNLGG